jgi:hypothetical protein
MHKAEDSIPKRLLLLLLLSSFRKHTLGCIQLQVDGVHLDEPTAVADTFAKQIGRAHV